MNAPSVAARVVRREAKLISGRPEDLSSFLTPSGASDLLSPSFYYNYFRFGFDLYFDGQSQRLTKIILHTSIPSHPDFCVYRKCPFIVYTRTAASQNQNSSAHSVVAITDTSKQQDLVAFSASGTLPSPTLKVRPHTVHPFGTMRFYGFDQGIIFEVTPHEFIASVCVFQ